MISLVEACRHRVKDMPGQKLFLKPSSLKLPADGKTAIFVSDDNCLTPLIRIFTGQLRLSSGRIYRTSSLSPPVGKLANVSGRLSPYEAVRYASKLYDVDFAKMMTTLMLIADIEDFVDQPISEIPPLYRNRFHHALWLSIRFDTYVYMQHVELSSDTEYCDRLRVFRDKILADTGFLLFTKNVSTASTFCDHGIVYSDRGLIPFESIEAAIEYFNNDQE